MKAFFDKFQSVKGVSFIGINGYEAKTTGEIANHIVNINLSIETAKRNDLQTLQNCNEADLLTIANKSEISLEIVKLALAEMIESATKNLSSDKSERTAQSQAQTDAYIHLTPAIRMHKETMEIHVFGQAISKVVLQKGTYKSVNSAPKTLAKQAITKELDLRAGKFRDFLVGNLDEIRISGETLERVK